MSAREMFAASGPIAKALGRYEQRHAQVEMAAAVEQVISHSGILLAEAGTGTGKTLAYLVPAIASGKRVIVSTGTRNLQEQIFFKDIKLLSEALGFSINAVYLKGQENYLCRRRLYELLNSPRAFAHPSGDLALLQSWAERTKSGDRMELETLSDSDPLWLEVCSTRETRIGQQCPLFAECFLARARAQAMCADIVIVNHHLYFADLATRARRGAVLPPHDVVVFDEAHLIEDIATEFFSVTVSSGRVDRLLDDIGRALGAAKLTDDQGEFSRKQLFAKASDAAHKLFSLLNAQPAQSRMALAAAEDEPERTQAMYFLDTALEALEMSLKTLEGRDSKVDHVTTRVAECRDDLATVLGDRRRGFVHWIEVRSRSVVVGASPIDVSPTLRDGIFLSLPTVVLTSATLSTGGDFSFLKSRLGLDFEVDELSLASPFDYGKQACLYLPRELPDPRDDRFVEAAAEEAERLIEITDGGALVLCTSNRNMRAFFERLAAKNSRPVLLQGDAPRTVLLHRFAADRRSVLCATASFWQGVDLPGDALRLVIIDKLPFAVPQDPLVAARIEHITLQSRNAFMEYQVPNAALSLKQGFGRLIRTSEDRGVVAIFDKRLRTKPYAKVFLRSLPDCEVRESLAQVSSWWGERT